VHNELSLNPLNSNYRLVPGVHKKLGYYHALIFDTKTNHWKGCKLPVNCLFATLIHQASKQAIDFHAFHKLLNTYDSDIASEQARNLWEQILETGFLIPEYPIEPQNTGSDLVVQNHLEIPKNTKQQLQQFIDSAGGLFAKEESNYIRNFKNWFSTHFDDRYLKLETFLSHSDFLSGQFLQPNHFTENDIAPILLGHQSQHSSDLQAIFPDKELDKGIYDIQILFRLDSLGNPVIENMVCNRPFVYTGRFNRNPAIEAHSQEIKDRIYTDNEVIYAHLALMESVSKQHICNVNNIFEYEITPFAPKAKNQFGFDELYLGINTNQILLIHKPSGKRVIPVVLHPLNGEQITHPILRLLWEIAHQDRYRFRPYQGETLTNAPYCPQLNWGKICLQSRKWTLATESVSTKNKLPEKLDDLGIPQYILAGHADRELLLNRYQKDDLQILWQELRRSKLTISDPSWFPAGLFCSSKGAAAYPQFVFQYSRPLPTATSTWQFNPITKVQDNCLCFILTLDDSDVPEVLECLFQHLKKPKVSSIVPCWFFLIYGKNGATQVRLRLLEVPPKQKNELLTTFSELLDQEGLDWKTASYFPETSKYGIRGLEISHRLFHMESKFLASKAPRILHLHGAPDDKENLIVRLWTLILSQSPNYRYLFEEIKGEVKSMPYHHVSAFKSVFTYVSNNDNKRFPTTTYLNIIRSHGYFETLGNSGILFLLNHLHMMVNRFFPQETQHHERRIRYRLYRELGKQIYSIPRVTTQSYPKPKFISGA
tara:strand:+ start:28760 stop:31063 length:2304 start_codon:yes stop_codon:yes gene_type:complete